MRLATWNVNSITARMPRLLDWLAKVQPDVCCLQETKCADDAFPVGPFAELGYDVAPYGEGRWNGVAVASRVGLADVRRGLPGDPRGSAPEARCLAVTCAGVRVYSVYVPNGRAVDDPHYVYKLAWLAALREDAKAAYAEHERLVLCGDFNLAPTDDDVWDAAAVHGSTHVTEPERQAYRELLALGLRDVPARALKYDRPYTYWDYRAGMFHKNMGMRIDLVLASPAVANGVRDAYVDREARKGTGASDHAPVVVDLADPVSGR